MVVLRHFYVAAVFAKMASSYENLITKFPKSAGDRRTCSRMTAQLLTAFAVGPNVWLLYVGVLYL